MGNNPYEDYGTRQDYLESLAIEYGVPLDSVIDLANAFGPSEDFDGLINTLEDLEDPFDSLKEEEY